VYVPCALRDCHHKLRKWVEDEQAVIGERETHESSDSTGDLNRLFAGLNSHELEPESNDEALLDNVSAEDILQKTRIDEIYR
jgi:hypothetical protein